MYTIQVGSLVLNGQLILLFVFGIAGWLTARFYLRDHPEEVQKSIGSLAFNAFFIWLLVWKGSLLLLEPIQTIQNPLSLLYFDGGVRGRWLAAVAVVFYIIYRMKKVGLSREITIQAATLYVLGGWCVYHVGFLAFQLEQWVYLSGHALSAAGLLLSILITRTTLSWTALVQRWQWFFIGLTFLFFFQSSRGAAVLSIDLGQIIAFAAAVALTLYVMRLNRSSIKS